MGAFDGGQGPLGAPGSGGGEGVGCVEKMGKKEAFRGSSRVSLSPRKRDPTLKERLASPTRRGHTMGPDVGIEGPSEPRLVIDRLVLTNFKSYAGKQVIGPFHPSFSAVVGPNGSGKSNVIDSMLFVFGFRAAKMRQSKLRELIHNSEAFPDLSFCQVDIHFRKVVGDGDYVSEVPGSALMVSRRATDKNQSTYYINGKPSNYTEVTTLLKAEGIDLDHKRFLILQGEVEMISQMKAKAEGENDDGLLEYLEDIIGTSSYKQPIEDLGARVEAMQDQLVLSEQAFGYVDRNMREHEEGKAAALLFLEREKAWKDASQRYLQLSAHHARDSLAAGQTALASLNEKIKADKHSIEALVEKVEKLKVAKESLGAQRKKLGGKLDAAKSSHKSCQQKKVQAAEKLKLFSRKLDTIQKALKGDTKALDGDTSALESIEEYSRSLSEDLAQLTVSLETESATLAAIRAQLSSKTKQYSDRIQHLQSELDPWEKRIDETDRECAKHLSSLEIAQGDLDALITEDSSAASALESKLHQLKVNAGTIHTLNEDLAQIQGKLSANESAYANAETQFRAAENDIAALRERVNYARSHVSSAETQNKVLAGLQSLKSTGRVAGFHGRLGDLGTIDDKYDVAVSTGGGSLSDFVVDSVEDAQACIDYLRKQNLGFGKFIVLQKLRKFNLDKINTPMNIPRLYDLITPVDPMFKPAFYSSMYDTLVATDLAQANKAATGSGRRWRVVTLDGKLVDVSGTMSGGGNRASRGAMQLASQKRSSSEFSRASVQAMVDELSNQETAFAAKEDGFVRMQRALADLRDRIPAKKSEITKLSIENDTLQAEVKELQLRAKDSSGMKRKTELEAAIESNSKQLEAMKAQKASLVAESADLHAEIKSLNKKILDVGGIELKKQTSVVADLKESLKSKTTKKEKDEMQAARLRANIEKLEKKIAQYTRESDDVRSVVAELESDVEQHDGRLAKVEEEIRSLEHEMDAIEIKVNEATEKMETEAAELERRNADIAKILKDIEKFTQQIRRDEEAIEDAQAQLAEIEYRDVLEFITWLEPDDPFLADYTQAPVEFEVADVDLKDLGDNCERLKDELLAMEVNLDVLPEYGRRLAEFNEKKAALDATRETVEQAQDQLKELNEKRLNEFKVGFENISATLKDMYFMITNGGVAELEFCDVHDPFQEGIAFSVMPPKKSWRNISNLSGGEKTLASLALVFALHHYKPTPLYVMDEIDAALDFKNVSIVANYIKSRTKNAQFIVISLRNNMFELAEKLVGIYKTNNMTRSATLVNKDLVH